MKILLMSFFLVFLMSPEGHSKDMERRVVSVTMGEKGMVPPKVQIKPNQHLTLKITRTTDKTCMTELKNQKDDGETLLPLNQEVVYEVGHFESPKTLKLLCGMEMVAGHVHIE